VTSLVLLAGFSQAKDNPFERLTEINQRLHPPPLPEALAAVTCAEEALEHVAVVILP
jgi:hypothetical protein